LQTEPRGTTGRNNALENFLSAGDWGDPQIQKGTKNKLAKPNTSTRVLGHAPPGDTVQKRRLGKTRSTIPETQGESWQKVLKGTEGGIEPMGVVNAIRVLLNAS